MSTVKTTTTHPTTLVCEACETPLDQLSYDETCGHCANCEEIVSAVAA